MSIRNLAALVGTSMLGLALSACAEAPMEQQVMATASYDDANCSKGFPIVVDIRNPTRKSVQRTKYVITAKQPGYSTELERQEFENDKIIAPGGSDGFCHELPGANPLLTVAIPGEASTYKQHDPKTLKYDVKMIYVEAE